MRKISFQDKVIDVQLLKSSTSAIKSLKNKKNVFAAVDCSGLRFIEEIKTDQDIDCILARPRKNLSCGRPSCCCKGRQVFVVESV